MESFHEGIDDDVTHRYIKIGSESNVPSPGARKWRFLRMGSDGRVSANKSASKLIAYNTDLYVLAYCLRLTSSKLRMRRSSLWAQDRNFAQIKWNLQRGLGIQAANLGIRSSGPFHAAITKYVTGLAMVARENG